jgi:diguanylate cyclase (GGDEF)-like protein
MLQSADSSFGDWADAAPEITPAVSHTDQHGLDQHGRRRRRAEPDPTSTPVGLLTCLGLLAVIVVIYVLAPMPEGIHRTLYVAIGAAAVLIGFLGLRHHRPQQRAGWLLILIGSSGWVLGDLSWTIEQYLLPDRFPAPSDGIYLCSYLALGAGSLVFVRTRGGPRDLAAVLDAAIITTSAGVLVGVFLIAPLAADSTLSITAKLVSSAYPLADLFLIGVLTRMFAAAGTRALSYHLLTAALVTTLVADIGYEIEILVSGDNVSTALTDGIWLVGYLLVGASACVPSMRKLVEVDREPAEAIPSRRRLLALAAGLMLPGVVLLVNGVTGGKIHWQVVSIGTLLLSGLVLYLMMGLLNIVRVQAVRLSALARSDSLTGAPNRRTWDHELPRACRQSLERGTTLCVAILDLDRFKAFNDTHGHPAGDRLLCEAVAAWSEELPAGALLARYGGEEFALLVPGEGAPEVERLLHRLRTVTPGGQTFSAGVAVWDPRTEPGSAIAGADEALYVAKRTGRDRVVIHGQEPAGLTPSPQRTASAFPPLPAFHMVVQPIVNLRTSRVTSHEALIRFTGALAELDVPEVFRQAHATGDGDRLELAAILAALALRDRPVGQDLYVNASARALTSARFMSGLPSRLHGVVVELSEDPEGVELAGLAEAVDLLRARGARIALDDLGAGGQEFARLATLRPDVIKADRSLVAGCAHDPGRTAVLSALVTYADHLGLTVCAEGVEEIADLRHLAALGITHVQGYLLARPAPDWQPWITIAAQQAVGGFRAR